MSYTFSLSLSLYSLGVSSCGQDAGVSPYVSKHWSGDTRYEMWRKCVSPLGFPQDIAYMTSSLDMAYQAGRVADFLQSLRWNLK